MPSWLAVPDPASLSSGTLSVLTLALCVVGGLVLVVLAPGTVAALRVGLAPVLLLALPAVSFAEARSVAVVPGECLQVTTAGRGPDIVFVPSLFGSAFAFRRVTAPLVAMGYRTTVVEPLGVGDSCRPERADYSLTAQADRLSRTLAALGIDQAVIVAHSIGASMALRLAYRHPARVRAIVSIEGGPAEQVATRGFRTAMRFAPLLKLFGGARLVRSKVHGQLVSRSADPSWVTDAVVDGYSAGAARDLSATLRAFSSMAESSEPELLQPRLRDVRCPVRLLLGAAPHEGGPTPEEVRVMEAALPALTVVRVPSVGHFLSEEAPAAVVAAVRHSAAAAPVVAAR